MSPREWAPPPNPCFRENRWALKSGSGLCYLRLSCQRFAPVACFPAHGAACNFCRSCQWFYPFPALNKGVAFFSRAWHWLHFFPRLVLVACFLALANGFTFFPRLAPVNCGCLFSRAWLWLYYFPPSPTGLPFTRA